MKALWLVVGFASALQAQSIAPPADATPLVAVQGRGVQIYRCDQQIGAFAYSFVSPEAELLNSEGLKVGEHSAGPTWTWNDGGFIVGKVLAKQASTDADSVPWLLLQTSAKGAVGKYLASAAYVRRTDTHGGNAPSTGCDATHLGTMLRVPYTATYTFYKKTK
ncbi:DUF3455 domain-containing protein [Granulicella cerasi]|uniref:DUF3455 domain-containing protein n=1 Tax=Granulicella cerasi TaxID=741063 RepID=A0ABW1Z627_9BACT|nr:DUF3455 domain-containing protein [Granulicella cerasi]